MVDIIEGLRQEHRNIESLLGVLEQELSVFDRGERPDYEVVLAVIDYFKDNPDSCHHPKEDMIVEKLKARDPGAAATVGDLEAQHQEGARRLRRVRWTDVRFVDGPMASDQLEETLLPKWLALPIFASDPLSSVAYATEAALVVLIGASVGAAHVVFPVALNALRPEDWADIALRWADRYDPFYQPGFEQKFNTLRRNILEMEAEAEAERAD